MTEGVENNVATGMTNPDSIPIDSQIAVDLILDKQPQPPPPVIQSIEHDGYLREQSIEALERFLREIQAMTNPDVKRGQK